jgi:hypothetical protein
MKEVTMNKELCFIGDHIVDPRVPVGFVQKKDGSWKAVFPIAGGAVYNPTGTGDIHYDQYLTDISLGWPNGGLVGNQLFPQVTVGKQSNKYYWFGREAWLPEIGDYRAPGTEANEIGGITVSKDTYYAQEHALQVAVTDEERENADNIFSPEADGTDLITSKIMLSREVVMQQLVSDTTQYASGLSTTLAGTAQWSDYTGASHPITVVKNGRRAIHAKCFMEPNTAVIPYRVMSFLEDHPDIIARIQYSERAILTPEIIAAVFGLQGSVIIPGVGIGAGQVGANGFAISASYLWGNDVILAWVPARAGWKVPAFAYEFVWGFGQGGPAQIVDRWREERRASDLVRVRRRYDLKKVGVEVNPASGDFGLWITGYLIKSATT